MLGEGRIKFFAAMSEASCAHPNLNLSKGSTDKNYLGALHSFFSKFPGADILIRSSANKIIKQIEKYSVPKQAIDVESCKILQKSFLNSFYESGGNNLSYYHERGFKDGIGMILDVWSTGTLAFHIDQEFELYITKFLNLPDEIKNNSICSGISILDEFNSIGNLPSLKEAILSEKLNSKEIFDVILSDESLRLREWIKENYSPGLDVRDCYFKSLKKLPSKSKWLNWLRFGITSTLSISFGYVLSNSPELASILGLTVGAVDLAFGTNATEMVFDAYHPKEWIGFLETKY